MKYLAKLSFNLLISCLFLSPALSFAQPTPTPQNEQTQEQISPETLHQELLQATNDKQWTKVIELATQYISNNREEPLAYHLRGIAYYQLKRKEEALREFLTVERLTPNDTENLKNIAALKNELKQRDAIEYYKRICALLPDDYKIHLETAQILENLKRFEESAQYFRLALKLEPKNLPAITAFGTMLASIGNYSESIELYTNCIKNGDENAILYLNLVSTFYLAGRYEEAITWADKAALKYNDNGIFLNKARSLSRLGRYAEAETIFRTNLTGPSITKPFENLEFATILSMQGCNSAEFKQCSPQSENTCCAKEREALTLLQKVAPKDIAQNTTYAPQLQLRLGLAHMIAGELEDAEVVLREGLAKYQNNTKVAGNYFAAVAITLFKFGEPRDIDNAVLMYREAIENSPDFADPTRVATLRQWPPRAVEELTKLKAYEENLRHPQKTTHQGCACKLGTTKPTASSLLFLLLTSILAFWRRKSKKLENHCIK